ncbi:tetratricopeptide repeat protein [Muriicola sp. E247]|uniref:tetratricopeptide repeat protein n=1 Tax=Muriicola sp. E247 TaxID=3242730 RepID=UPI0035254332
MTATTEIELKDLIDKLKGTPKNLDLINRIAIGYFENPSMLTDNEDLKHFELAYSTKKTIKSTHNLAWYLYFEWGEENRAIEIQKQIIKQKPKSYLPYYLLGFMLLEKEDYKNALENLLIAKEKSDRRDILHNIGFCYFKLGDLKTSRDYFKIANTEFDFEFRSAFNQAVLDFQLQDTVSTRKLADRLFQNIENNSASMIGGYETGLLYFMTGDFDKATESLIKQGIDGVDLTDWKELSYSLFVSDSKKWISQHQKMISERESWIVEINTKPDEWDFDSEQEKNERLSELKNEIKNINELISKGISKPDVDLSENVWIEPCGCLLFDCKRHENQPDDE